MAIRNIRQEGDEILKKVSREVDVVDDKIKELIKDMLETMHQQNGVGLAAVQVGILKRIIVIDLYDDNPPIVLINPVIIEQKGEQTVEEGCLSFPNKYAQVEGLNENGKKVKIKGKDLLAQALAHEIDHLNGHVFVEIMIPGTLEYVTPEEETKK